MGYRNKTYVIFDGDKDMWAYAYMLGWKKNRNIDFDFYDAHDLRKILTATNEEYIKRILRERLSNTKQAIVIVGDLTKSHHRFVRWEIENCLSLGIPIIVANLNKRRSLDTNLCPPILKGTPTVHVAFGARIIKYALDNFCDNFQQHKTKSDLYYNETVYRKLGYE